MKFWDQTVYRCFTVIIASVPLYRGVITCVYVCLSVRLSTRWSHACEFMAGDRARGRHGQRVTIQKWLNFGVDLIVDRGHFSTLWLTCPLFSSAVMRGQWSWWVYWVSSHLSVSLSVCRPSTFLKLFSGFDETWHWRQRATELQSRVWIFA